LTVVISGVLTSRKVPVQVLFECSCIGLKKAVISESFLLFFIRIHVKEIPVILTWTRLVPVIRLAIFIIDKYVLALETQNGFSH